jgi:hypothetical protein
MANEHMHPIFADILNKFAENQRKPQRNIITSFFQNEHLFEWRAYYEGDEPDDEGRMKVGIGINEQEAIDELKAISGE